MVLPPRYGADARVADRVRGVAVPEAASERPADSSSMVDQAGGRGSPGRASFKKKVGDGIATYGIDVNLLSAISRMGTDTA